MERRSEGENRNTALDALYRAYRSNALHWSQVTAVKLIELLTMDANNAYLVLSTQDGKLLVKDRHTMHYAIITCEPEHYKNEIITSGLDVWMCGLQHFETHEDYLNNIDIFDKQVMA